MSFVENPFSKLLVSNASATQDYWVWATVTREKPLQVKLDGEPNPLSISPDSVVKVELGDRVRIHMYHNRATIMGVAPRPNTNDSSSENKGWDWLSCILYMVQSHSIILPKPAEELDDGIILVWRSYHSGSLKDWGLSMDYIPKEQMIRCSGKVYSFLLSNGDGIAFKELMISTTEIRGSRFGASASAGRMDSSNFVLEGIFYR